MKEKKKTKLRYIFITSIILMFIAVFSAKAYIMSSDNYRMARDSINVGGTEDSESASYKLRDTIGEIGTGVLEGTTFNLKAGYRQMETTYISITVPSSITLSPNITGISGAVSNGDGTWTVKTDELSGYNLSIRAALSPALQSGTYSFADYTPTSADTPDYDWSLGSASSEFGFSPYNTTSQISKYKNDGSACNTGANITDGNCWYNLSTSNEQIINRTSYTSLSGEDTKINFRAEVASTQATGVYTATITVTAVNN